MGSLLNLSVIKGPTRQLKETFLDKLFESVANGATADNIAVIFEGKTRTYFPKTTFLPLSFHNRKWRNKTPHLLRTQHHHQPTSQSDR